jgi:hypothetical protein
MPQFVEGHAEQMQVPAGARDVQGVDDSTRNAAALVAFTALERSDCRHFPLAKCVRHGL